jgi:hypothetical protein
MVRLETVWEVSVIDESTTVAEKSESVAISNQYLLAPGSVLLQLVETELPSRTAPSAGDKGTGADGLVNVYVTDIFSFASAPGFVTV